MPEAMTLPGSSMNPLVQPKTHLTAYKPGNWFCGHCGHALLALKWEYPEVYLKKGYQDFSCQNTGCAVFNQSMRIPVKMHHFEKLL